MRELQRCIVIEFVSLDFVTQGFYRGSPRHSAGEWSNNVLHRTLGHVTFISIFAKMKVIVTVTFIGTIIILFLTGDTSPRLCVVARILSILRCKITRIITPILVRVLGILCIII